MIITIDGPAGSGKSFVARELAKHLGIYYLYTGLLYRAVGYIWTQVLGNDLESAGVEDLNKSAHPEEARSAVLKGDLSFIQDIRYEYRDQKAHVFYKGKDITDKLYGSAVDKPASILSALPPVRAALLHFQRELSLEHDLVAEGRDCGSVVFPNADYKFYLTADIEVRAQRVIGDEKRSCRAQGRRSSKSEAWQKVKAELEARDERDKNRSISPLTVPKGGIIIDNSGMNRPETIEKFLTFIKK